MDKGLHDRHTISAVLEGDRQAARKLISQHQRLVGQIVSRMIRREDDRPDVCQDVFLKVFQSLAAFQYQSKLSTWIARITYNTCLHYLEKKKFTLFSDEHSEGATIDEAVCGEDCPQVNTADRQLSSNIAAEVDKLPVLHGTVLTLYHFHDMTYREIGDILQLPEGTVKSYLFRGRKMLKDRLLARFQEEELCA